MQADGTVKKSKVRELYVFEGMGKKKVTEVVAGDINDAGKHAQVNSDS